MPRPHLTMLGRLSLALARARALPFPSKRRTIIVPVNGLLRMAYAVGVMVPVVWLLRSGLPLGAVAVVVVGVSMRRAVESGRAARLVRHFANPS